MPKTVKKKKKAPKRKKKLTKGKLKAKLWVEIRTYIKNRDGYLCQLCNKAVEGSDAHCSHILPKGQFPRYEFEEWNLKTLCYHCHMGFWHKNPLMAAAKFKRFFPERYALALEKAENYAVNKPRPLTTDELLAKYLLYTTKNSDGTI